MPTRSLEIICESRIVAIIRLDNLHVAMPLLEALLAGGIRAIEFTLTNRDSLRCIKQAIDQIAMFRNGHATLGLGSIRNVTEAKEALAAGAQFLVTPITRPDIIKTCKDAGCSIASGAMTPTEIALAWDEGADLVKVFPAKSLGPNYIRDVLAPMPYLRLMPTGGVDLQNLKSYLDAGAVGVGMGGQLLDKNAIALGDWGAIEKVARLHSQTAATVS